MNNLNDSAQRKTCDGYNGYDTESTDTNTIPAILLMYILFGFTGFFVAWKWRHVNISTESMMLASRNMGVIVGICALTASLVSGTYIIHTAESVVTPGYGLAWTQTPFGYFLSLLLGGMVFVKKMKDANYMTILDPIQERYGQLMTILCFLPAILGEIFWSASILEALGVTLSAIIELSPSWTVILSTIFVISYTMTGGLFSVAYTAVVQVAVVYVGLWICIPFAVNHPLASNIGFKQSEWIGTVNDNYILTYLDSFMVIILGGIPWQVYFQNILSQKSVRRSQYLSFVAGLGCLIMGIPPVLIGAIASSTDWNSTSYALYGCPNDNGGLHPSDYDLVLPLVLKYLTPNAVGIIGLIALAAAVVSSVDSSILAASTMFAHNIYLPIRKSIGKKTQLREVSDLEIVLVLRVSIVIIAVVVAIIAIIARSTYALWSLLRDMVYVLLFPQLTLVLFLPFSNAYGALVGFVIGLLFRLTAGDPSLGLSAVVKYPQFKEDTNVQMFPFRTFCMVLSSLSIFLGSFLAWYIFIERNVSKKYDFLLAFEELDSPAESPAESLSLMKLEIMDKRRLSTASNLSALSYEIVLKVSEPSKIALVDAQSIQSRTQLDTASDVFTIDPDTHTAGPSKRRMTLTNQSLVVKTSLLDTASSTDISEDKLQANSSLANMFQDNAEPISRRSSLGGAQSLMSSNFSFIVNNSDQNQNPDRTPRMSASHYFTNDGDTVDWDSSSLTMSSDSRPLNVAQASVSGYALKEMDSQQGSTTNLVKFEGTQQPKVIKELDKNTESGSPSERSKHSNVMPMPTSVSGYIVTQPDSQQQSTMNLALFKDTISEVSSRSDTTVEQVEVITYGRTAGNDQDTLLVAKTVDITTKSETAL